MEYQTLSNGVKIIATYEINSIDIKLGIIGLDMLVSAFSFRIFKKRIELDLDLNLDRIKILKLYR